MALIEHGVPVPCVSLINGYLRTSNSLAGQIWKLHLCSLIDLFTFLLSLFTRFIYLFSFDLFLLRSPWQFVAANESLAFGHRISELCVLETRNHQGALSFCSSYSLLQVQHLGYYT